jgi:dihydroorotate dehydrogenase (NAD+) catalytic subunit
MHPVAVRVVHDVRSALPERPIVGVGGVASGWDAVELMVVGANAVQVGTATFADPRAAARIAAEMTSWASRRGEPSLQALTNRAAGHDG